MCGICVLSQFKAFYKNRPAAYHPSPPAFQQITKFFFVLSQFQNNLSELQALIVKWRNSTQLMLYELQSAFSADGKKVSLTQLIDTFGLEDQLLHYSRTEEDFVDA